ncbi:MAG: hypothetical protein AAGG44_11425 [Planctomycetota bacterium]
MSSRLDNPNGSWNSCDGDEPGDADHEFTDAWPHWHQIYDRGCGQFDEEAGDSRVL